MCISSASSKSCTVVHRDTGCVRRASAVERGDGLQGAIRRQEADGMAEDLTAMAKNEKLFDSIIGDYR
jgi:hypothetical protein